MLLAQVARDHVLVGIYVILVRIVNSVVDWPIDCRTILLIEELVVLLVENLFKSITSVLSIVSVLEGREIVHVLLNELQLLFVVTWGVILLLTLDHMHTSQLQGRFLIFV